MKSTSTQPQQENRRSTSAMESGMEECIANCLECAKICTRLISHCLDMGGKHAESHHINLLSNCATICGTSAKFMITNSEFHRDTCRICATVCNACADDCEQIDPDDPMMRECIDLCRNCAESCERMAGH